MSAKFLGGRDAELSKCIFEVDLEIKKISASIAPRIRLAGAFCVDQEEAEILEKQFQASVDYVIEIPATSEEGVHARRELIKKLIEIEDYLDFLLRAPCAKPEIVAKRRWNLGRKHHPTGVIRGSTR